MNTSARKKVVSVVISTTVASVFLLSALPQEAFAKRLGGGQSAGRQSSGLTNKRAEPSTPASTPAQNAAPAQAAKPAQPAATPAAATPPQQPARNRWLGPLAGLAAGLGIAALFSHLGLGGELASFMSSLLMVGLFAFAAMFLYRMFKKSNAPAQTPAYGGAGAGTGTGAVGQAPTEFRGYEAPAQPVAQPVSQPAAQTFGQPVSQAPAASGVQYNAFGQPLSSLEPVAETAGEAALVLPQGFDQESFLASAKSVFVRLQAAFDKSDASTLREFVSDELFAQFSKEMAERGTAVNHTDVVTLNAELLAYEQDPSEHIASVLFTGTIREAANAPAEAFEEVWNLSKPSSGKGGWLLCGLQQL